MLWSTITLKYRTHLQDLLFPQASHINFIGVTMRQSSILDVWCHHGALEELDILVFVHANGRETVT